MTNPTSRSSADTHCDAILCCTATSRGTRHPGRQPQRRAPTDSLLGFTRRSDRGPLGCTAGQTHSARDVRASAVHLPSLQVLLLLRLSCLLHTRVDEHTPTSSAEAALCASSRQRCRQSQPSIRVFGLAPASTLQVTIVAASVSPGKKLNMVNSDLSLCPVFMLGIRVLLAGLTPAGVANSWLLGTLVYAAFGWAGYLLVCIYFLAGSAVRCPRRVIQSAAVVCTEASVLPCDIVLLLTIKCISGCAGHEGEAGTETAGRHCGGSLGETLRCKFARSHLVVRGASYHCSRSQCSLSVTLCVQGSVWGSGAAGIICAALALLIGDPGMWQVSTCRQLHKRFMALACLPFTAKSLPRHAAS